MYQWIHINIFYSGVCLVNNLAVFRQLADQSAVKKKLILSSTLQLHSYQTPSRSCSQNFGSVCKIVNQLRYVMPVNMQSKRIRCVKEVPVGRSADGTRVHALGRASVLVCAVRSGLHQTQLAQEACHDPPRAETLRLRLLRHAVCIHHTRALSSAAHICCSYYPNKTFISVQFHLQRPPEAAPAHPHGRKAVPLPSL